MKNSKRVSTPAAALCAALLTLTALPSARADEATKPMALQSVMKQLGQDMQAVTAAISKEDWARVAELAPKIANHEQPPVMEKMRILTWLGTDAGKFRGFDGQVHDAAASMGDAAARGDGQAVIAAFAKLQQSCLGCHQNYRTAFIDHFYEKR
ncbi:MAG: cytochrome c [Burkholderiaceae bacterium]|jgi:cytochrome c556|nr:cytochrome c [Burkholderiaceae bacterium]